MSRNSRPCLLCGTMLVSLVLGCGQGNPPTPQGKGDNAEGKEGWLYNSAERGFSLRLPSADWKKNPKDMAKATFYAHRGPAAMLAGVFFVEQQTLDEFQDLVASLNNKFSNMTRLLVKPIIQEGTNRAGNKYVYTTMCEKGKGGLSYVFVAQSYTWLKDNSLTVGVIFEGQGKMRSDLFKSQEYADFEKIAKAVCLSVDKARKEQP